jgi:acyl dehydratase
MPAFLHAGASVGDELPTVARKFAPDDFKRGGERTLHTDAEAAKREGLKAPVAIGPQVAALIFRQMRLSFGPAWMERGSWELTFRRPAYASDFCIAKGRIIAKEPVAGGVRFECEVWIDTQDQERVIVGKAAGTLDLPGNGATDATLT